ncbi:MAG TPA: phosphoribosylformylglycinamidine synthase [Candidatus Oscillibacter excrementigallinarum]|uniref:Phosphoribosylformylglycinamidine synthase n=1 Tax=Candidatus Oscillibacter excrementigallinarum TaxID=2838716 RepID=A0A9D2LHE3_9FIRM|nr:phosphoribosylformylglycinamidine synthase [Candidatus Oscillibacter excrementigallinarum]
MVRRIYVEKKPGLRQEAQSLLHELRTVVGVSALEDLRLLNRYDVEGLDEAAFRRAVGTVFSEPQVDDATAALPAGDCIAFGVEPLPGQFDQRADSAAQCIQLMTQGERPTVRTAKVYLLFGPLTAADAAAVKRYVINPVECREASLDLPESLAAEAAVPADVETVSGFTALDRAGREALLARLGLAMDLEDLTFLQTYFRDTERRDPTLTEVRVVDTYWSDHCRHTTFSTHLDRVEIHDPAVRAAYDRYLAAREEVYGKEKAAQRPQTLMDIATIGAKALKKRGLLPELDESEEINACSIHVSAQVDGSRQDWLLMFKNETHNHPTEIEPFGGAATCIGGCIRDPLSGRAYVHQAMRFTGCGDPRTPVADTLPGKLPQRKIAQTAAAGYSSYGNQIGLATGLVSEVYHEGYLAKHLECGVVAAAAPAENVVRQRPAPGDVVILLGGRTGRDGIGGATGSSKSHNRQSLTTMASEVQKGNAPEERKIQRLFRDGDVTRLIKRCNDFGAGGVSVAVGELADGLDIDLDAVRKKYDGLDGTELAISESQERMAVVVAPENADRFIAAAQAENLEAYPVAVVTEAPRMVMRWRGKTIVDLSRDFLNTNGAVKHACAAVPASAGPAPDGAGETTLRAMAASLQCASRRGLAERFDSTIGAGSVLMPFGGKFQRTPAQVMAALLPVLPGQETDQASVMAWGFDPEAMAADPYRGAYDAVRVSLAKLVAAGADYRRAYLTLQEFFEKLRDDPRRWGRPFAALLGALDAQLDFGAAAIGGKDSMSGTFNDLDVPPTLISFAIAPIRAGEVLSPEFKKAGHGVYLFGSGDTEACKASWAQFHTLCRAGKVQAAWAVEHGLAEAVSKMSFGNGVGFLAEEPASAPLWYTPMPGVIVAEVAGEPDSAWCTKLGVTTGDGRVTLGVDSAPIGELLSLNESVLEDVYPSRTPADAAPVPVLEAPAFSRAAPKIGTARPKVLIPVFPGTNCEYDSARAVLRAGLEPQILVLNNQTPDQVASSAARFAQAARSSQILFLPGGFSGGDEPDGSGKFITAFLRSPQAADAVMDLLNNRDGLALGICNGFQALIKLGLVPFGEIRDTDATCPTLTYNVIGRHQSRIVRTRVASNRSPWLARAQVGDIVSVPISHGEGRFLCPPDLLAQLAENGQIATQYVGPDGAPTLDIDGNPNGSVWAVEGITSPDGRVLGKMGHSERVGPCLYRNVPGHYDLGLFQAARDYFAL